MNRTANYIRNRLSLRSPQKESLKILSELADKLSLKKNADLALEFEKVKESYPTCTDFERNFPSLCFALATGVGKTRLMGAFISYLYKAKGIKNFFVLSPNLTIYNKLIKDFSDPSNPKYVFRGISDFVHRQPRIVTGDNYNWISQTELFQSHAHINVFNISKINAETRGGKSPRIKRLTEYLGESYFKYLSNLEDLVLLMDESHHYRADRGMEVINELNPILGLELTATPQVERSGRTIKFKNVVYEYSLAKAIRDGFVKEPAVATRRNFDPSNYSDEGLDRIKLEDGIRIHEDTKVALDIYALDNKVEPVKPFVLVVAKDTEHAGKLREMITSKTFFDGNYIDKVMEIHSKQRGSEKDENIRKLISLEDPKNKIEIVIHVNMLKEGWDVTNLYTIIPLRTAASMTLREQTIGRGLRLPYGARTGDNKADKLTIVAHDKFQEIIDAANSPDSIIRRENIIEINEEELSQKKEVLTSRSNVELTLEEVGESIENIEEPEEKEKAKAILETHKIVIDILPQLRSQVKNVKDLDKEEIKQIVIKKIKERVESVPQMRLFVEDEIEEVEAAYNEAVKVFTDNIIEIPRINISQSDQVIAGFNDFDLDTGNLNYQPVTEEIIRKTLREQEDAYDIIIGKGGIISDSLENVIVNELINYPEIDYNEQVDLLFKLAGQATRKIKTYLDEDKATNVVQYHKREIGNYIYSQMMEHFYCETSEYEKPVVYPFTKIEEHNYSKYSNDNIYHLTNTIEPASSIPTKLFTGFRKACHRIYKFANKTEKDFAVILENPTNRDVLKWLKPAKKQFEIWWKHNSRRYWPDFVVETTNAIYIVETKMEINMENSEVKEKAKAAIHYCRIATEHTTRNEGKPWKYLLIPHSQVTFDKGFRYFAEHFELSNETIPCS